MTIKAQLLSLVSLLFVVLSGLFGDFVLEARTRLSTLQAARSVEDAADAAGQAMIAWALERGIVTMILNDPKRLAEASSVLVDAQRRAADESNARAITIASGLNAPELAPLIQVAEQARARLDRLQRRVDLVIAARGMGEEMDLQQEWFRGATAMIEAFAALREGIDRREPEFDGGQGGRSVLRQAIFQISEYAGRERAMLAAALTNGRPMTASELAILSEISGHVDAGWAILRARRHLLGAKTQVAVDDAVEAFLTRHQALRVEMRDAARVGAYPISAEGWFWRATAAIDAVHAIQTTARADALDRLHAKERVAFWTLIGGGVLLGATVIVFLVILRVILIGVARQFADERAQIEALQKQERMSSLGALVAGIAHEINTPVGIAVTAASYLADMTQKLERDYRADAMTRSALEEYVETAAEGSSMILKNLERAAALISSFKRVSVDQASDEKRAFNLSQLIEDVLTTLRPQLRQTKHRVEAVCPTTLLIEGFPGLIAQILTNLVMNSLIHAFPNGRVGVIMISARRSDGALVLTYRDDGVGASDATVSKMFEPFFTTRRGSGGSGLGLSIVHTLVTQKLGGSISVESASPGLSFTITLPDAPAESAVATSVASGRWRIIRFVRRRQAATPSISETVRG